ncbi:hypothetical protein, conserved [Babesia ovata]|uniref:C3H1-type domain-containing protein n=1 Tax=Babesia ovata TaxID=189622 RepID=A0A2H6KJS3_9APIC|nr:uncharacterized protein BOVATA_047240 [Babesia ovata]GBE63231.1 hypothetical protein, conserved [Babesia ovata]
MAITMKGKALDDIDARRISLGQLAGQLSGFIGGGDEVKNALVNGLRSNVNQLEKLLKASCGGKGCDCDIKNFRVGHLKNLQKTFEKYDEIATKINGLNKEIAEKSKAPEGAPPGGESEIDELKSEIDELQKEILQQSSTLKDKITIVIDAVKIVIESLDAKKNKVVDAQSQVNELKKQIEEGENNDRLKNKLKQSEEQLKVAKNAFPEKDSKSLDSHQKSMMSLKSLQTLCQHCNEVSKMKQNNEQPKKLLENLCTGLEKFLGYHDGNYTGEGIVYSDLDRLCDGVMAFLHGVLGNIKPKLGQHKDTLTSALSTLESTNDNGITKYRAAIAAVAGGVRAYNERVAASNESVKSVVTALRDSVGHTLTDKLNAINENNVSQDAELSRAVEAAEALVKTYASKGTDFKNDFRDKIYDDSRDASSGRRPEYRKGRRVDKAVRFEDRDELKDLNAELKSRINNAIENIVHEGNRLSELSAMRKSDMNAMTSKIRDTLNGLKRCVDDKIHEAVNTLVKQFNQRLQKIWDDLKKISQKLEEHVVELLQWIEKADKSVDEAMKGVTKIEKNDVGAKKQFDAECKAEELKQKATELYNKFQSAKSEVDRLVNDGKTTKVDQLNGWKNAANAVIGKAEGKCTEILKRVDEKSAENGGQVKIKEQAEALQKKATDLLSAYAAAYTKVSELVSKVTAAVADLETGMKEDLERLQKEIVKNMKKHVGGMLLQIQGQVEKDLGKAGTLFSSLEAAYNASQGNEAPTSLAPGPGDPLEQRVKHIKTEVNKGMKENGGELEVNDVMKKYIERKNKAQGGGDSLYKKLIDKEIKNSVSSFENMSEFATQKSELQSGTVVDSTKAVDTHVSTITQELQAIAHYVDNTKENPNPPPADSDPNGIKQYLENLKNTGLEKGDSWTPLGGGAANSKGLLKIKAEIEGALGGIKSKMETDFQSAQTSTTNGSIFKTLSSQIFQNLSALVEEFKKAGQKVNEQLNTLKVDKIGRTYLGDKAKPNTLQNLYNLLASQNDALKKTIQETEKLIKLEADQFRTKCINALTQHTGQQVSSAIATLTAHAQKQYVSSVKFLLTKFADRVQKILKPLPTAIDTDRKEGFKGFMRTFEGKITDNATTDENIKKLKDLASESTDTAEEKATLFKKLSQKFKEFVGPLKGYLDTEIKRLYKDINAKKNPPVIINDTDKHPYADALDAVQSKLNTLLDEIHNSGHFTHSLTINLGNLSTALHSLVPTNFEGPCNTLPDVLKSGMRKFTEQLSHAYVNRYSGMKFQDELLKKENDFDTSTTDNVLSTEGRNCAKVCLTIVDILDRDMYTLKHSSLGGWKNDNIISTTKLGAFLKECGYIVSDSADKQNGQLDRHHNGENICKLFSQKITYIAGESKNLVEKYFSTKNGVEVDKIIKVHYTMFDKYRYVCHLKHVPNAKPPTTVNEMLHWLSAIQWNPMYNELRLHFDTWFKASTNDYKLSSDSFDVAAPYRDAWTMKATVSIKNIKDLFNTVTLRSYEILRAFVGHGHADGRYACEFYTNPDNLEYPNDISKCFDMLVDICLRLNYQLHFLYTQCCNGPDSSGWRDCHYGRHVGGSNWSCNKLQCPGQQGDQSANQIANQTCEQHPKCCIKSPLQAYLEDGLPGFLPHTFTLPSCKLTCSVRDHRGIPCITPMGFTDIGIAASHTKTGAHLKSLLQPFCSSAREPLTMLCAFFTCLIRRPPQTLGDMFAFYYNFLEHYSGQNHKQIAFDEAARKANFGNPDTKLDIVSIQGSKSHTAKHSQGDLFGIISCNTSGSSKNPVVPCGSYMQPLTLDVVSMFSETRAANYLSWIVYITETFCVLLMKLLDECCNNCNKPGTKCHDKACAEKCEVKLAYEAEQSKNAPTSPAEHTGKRHSTDCHSIVKCQLTHPTLYKYGFTFGSPWNLSGDNGVDNKRSCQDFCQALGKVCHGRSVLADLVINKIPAFLWEIRYKFFYTLVALWSLSLLYLLHIAVVRLDVLRIRSHLRSPSSHRIAAQSLLAAARVKALANVKYFSP